MQNRFGLLFADVMPIYMIMPRYSHNYSLFYQLLDNSLFTTVILMLSWEKPLVKPMAPRSIFHHISFWSTILVSCLLSFAIFYFPFHKPKIPKILLYHFFISIRSHFANNREGIDNPFIALVQVCLIVCAGIQWLACCLLLDWYLGSQN